MPDDLLRVAQVRTPGVTQGTSWNPHGSAQAVLLAVSASHAPCVTADGYRPIED